MWTRHLHTAIHPPLVAPDGSVTVVGEQGDTLVLQPDGTDRAHLQLGPGPMSAPAFLTDGTLVVVNGAGEVLFVRAGDIVHRARVGDRGIVATTDEGAPAQVIARLGALRMRGGRLRRAGVVVPPQGADGSPGSLPSVLPLYDGGVVVAFDRDLVSLDDSGTLRARAQPDGNRVPPRGAAGPRRVRRRGRRGVHVGSHER